MNQHNGSELEAEFREFMEGGTARPGRDFFLKVRELVEADLCPSPLKVFTKLSGIHIVTSLATLSVCPQFGLRILGDGHGLMSVFMKAGPNLCFVLCGAFFLSFSILASGLWFSKSDWRVFSRHQALQVCALTLLSLGALIMFQAEVVLGLGILWFVGAFLGGILVSQVLTLTLRPMKA